MWFAYVYTACSEKAMAPHSSTLAWKIPWTEKPGGLQSMGSLPVWRNWATSLSLFTFMHWRRKWQPTPVFLPENPRDGGASWAAVSGVAYSRTRLKRHSSSSSSTPPVKSWFVIGCKSCFLTQCNSCFLGTAFQDTSLDFWFYLWNSHICAYSVLFKLHLFVDRRELFKLLKMNNFIIPDIK